MKSIKTNALTGLRPLDRCVRSGRLKKVSKVIAPNESKLFIGRRVLDNSPHRRLYLDHTYQRGENSKTASSQPSWW